MLQRYTKLFVVVALIFWRFIADSDDIVCVDIVGFDVKIAVAVDSVGFDAAFAVDEDVTVVVVDVDLGQD